MRERGGRSDNKEEIIEDSLRSLIYFRLPRRNQKSFGKILIKENIRALWKRKHSRPTRSSGAEENVKTFS
jgi:hypothetical protein